MLPARGVRIRPAGEWPGCQESSDVNLSAPSVLPPLFDLETSPSRRAFCPAVVSTFEDAGLNDALVESLILKFLINQGSASGRRIAAELGLPFGPFPEFLRQLKNQQIVNYAEFVDGQRLCLHADRRWPGQGQGLFGRMHLRGDGTCSF